MKLELTKEEREQLTFWCQANILTITNLIQENDPKDTPEDIQEYRKALASAQRIYQKLTGQQPSLLHSAN